MMPTASDKLSPSQLDKFTEAARALEADEDEARWDSLMKRVAQVKPQPGKPK
jgi:hypothetical protein